MEVKVSALEMRRKLGGILDRVYKKGDHVTVTRGQTPIAILVPPEEHDKWVKGKNKLQSARSVWDKIDSWKKENPHQLKNLEKSTETIRKMRDSR